MWWRSTMFLQVAIVGILLGIWDTIQLWPFCCSFPIVRTSRKGNRHVWSVISFSTFTREPTATTKLQKKTSHLQRASGSRTTWWSQSSTLLALSSNSPIITNKSYYKQYNQEDNTTNYRTGNRQRRHRQNVSTTPNETDTTSYTLQYSPTFQRHIVWNGDRVVQSFEWLDEALVFYPTVQLRPIETFGTITPEQLIISGADTGCSNNATIAATNRCYPILSREDLLPCEARARQERIQNIVVTHLRWFPTQVDALLEQWPELVYYPLEELQLRLRFLLAPFPSSEYAFLQQVNHTQDIDWPVQFYVHGRGCGMSIAQVSHALQVIPHFIWRLPTWQRGSYYGIQSATSVMMGSKRSLVQLYEQTPAAVTVMTNKQLDAWLAGALVEDTIALAYLHWKGWEWNQCRLLLHAWPCLLQPSLDVSWEVYERGNAVVRNRLLPDTVQYIRARLQLRPWHLQAMYKTHSRLTGYSQMQIQRNMDFLQSNLELSSSQLRALLLLMPSLLGASVESMAMRIQFWLNQVGLTVAQLRSAALRKPALLQYSVTNNLLPKFHFFRTDLQIEGSVLVQLTRSHPDIWAYSLEGKLRPMANALVTRCGCNMTLVDYGQIVAQAPELVRCNWQTNLSCKVDFLQSRLQLSQEGLTRMIISTPRILLKSVKGMDEKIDLIQESHIGAGSDVELLNNAIQENAGLLLTSAESLRNRIGRSLERRMTPGVCSIAPGKGRGYRRRRSIQVLSNDDGNVVEQHFNNVHEAAQYAGTSIPSMYRAIRQKLRLKDRLYVYANWTNDTLNNRSDPVRKPGTLAEVFNKTPDTIPGKDQSQSTCLTIEVSGSAFPPEATVRGRRRAGGLAMHVHNWSLEEWKTMCATIWSGRKYRLLQDRRTLILGYPYMRPSRPRCGLYAVREALHAVTVWVEKVSTPSIEVEIRSDCSYAISLLQNTSRVLEWGKTDRLEDFVYTGDGPLYKANPDILYPIARALHQLTTGKEKLGTSVTVNFRLNELHSPNGDRVKKAAKLAAKLMYDSL